MSELTFIAIAPDSYRVTGDLTFASINKKTVKNLLLAKDTPSLSIDLAAVTATDSAGLALMIEWIKLSQAQGIRLIFKNIPEQLLALSKLSGLDEIEHFADSDFASARYTHKPIQESNG